MANQRIGQVIHYYDHQQVAVLALDVPLHLGDYVQIAGHTTSLHQKVTSLEIDHHAIAEAVPGDTVALKVVSQVRPHDVVYQTTAKETAEAQLEEELELARSW